MTSKISFSKLRQENIKHRLGMVLVTAGLFFIYTLSFIISVQNICIMEKDSHKELLSSITKLSGPGSAMGVFSVLSAILLAISGFRFLHSRTEMDFYHSLPVRRRSEIYLIMTNDTGIFLALHILVSVFQCAVIVLTGYFSASFAVNTLWSLLCHTLIFLVSYLTMALAMILTGNTFVGILGYGVFASFSPLLLGQLYGSLAGVFYHTYYNYYISGGEVFNYFSPVSLASGLCADNGIWIWKDHIPYFIANVVWIVLLLVMDFLLFEKRASEAAGKAVAFVKVKPVIRVLLVIPAAIYGGLILYSVSFTEFKPWIIVGMAVGGFLTHGIIECIYRFDIRGLVAYKRQMLISVAVSFGIVAFFWLDVSGYDTFLPSEEKVSSILIDNPGFADDMSFWGKERNGVTGETMKGTLEVLEKVVEQNDQNLDAYSDGSNVDVSGYASYVIRYRMKNGKEKKRQYVLTPELVDQLMEQVFDTQEYKRDTYSLYTADWSNVTGVEVWSPMQNQKLELTKEQRAELFRTYLEEHAKLDYETAKQTVPFGQLMVSHLGSEYDPAVSMAYGIYDSETTDYYFLYPCFKKTIRYLTEELGLNIETSMKDFDIKKLEITRYNEETGDADSFAIKDREFITSVKDKLIYGEYLSNAGNETSIDTSYEIYTTIKTETGDESFIFYTDRETIEKMKKYDE